MSAVARRRHGDDFSAEASRTPFRVIIFSPASIRRLLRGILKQGMNPGNVQVVNGNWLETISIQR
jgi:hypothetical protein